MSSTKSTSGPASGPPAIALAALVAIAARLSFHWYTGFIFDDAYITFRYVENLAAGLGFVYNTGERVLGTTTPLFAMILTALRTLGIPVIGASLAVSLSASAATAIILLFWAHRLGFGRLSLLPALGYALFSRLLPTETGGMETAIFNLLLTAALYLRHRSRPAVAYALGALALLVRPEGGILLALLFAYDLFVYRRNLWRRCALAAGIVLPWVIFAWVYFGSPIPNSIPAKWALYSRVWAEPPLQKFIFVMGWHNPMGIALSVTAAVGLWWFWRRRRFGILEAAWIVSLVVFLVTSGTKIFRWYISPLYPVMILLASASIFWLGERLRLRWLRDPSATAAGLIVAAAMLLLAASNYPSFLFYRASSHELTTIHQGVVEYLHRHAGAGDVLATEDIGEVGYYSNMHILDRAGLVSPQAIPYNASGDYFGLIRDYRPEWVVISKWDPTSEFLQNDAFRSQYVHCTTFWPPHGVKWEFELYARRDIAPDECRE